MFRPVYRFPAAAQSALQNADIILAVVYSEGGLWFAHDALLAAAPSAPLVFWFFDCELAANPLPAALTTFLRNRAASFWAFTEAIQQTLR